MGFTVKDSGAKTVISCKAGFEVARAAAKETGIKEVYVIGGEGGDKKVESLRGEKELVRKEIREERIASEFMRTMWKIWS